MVDVLERWVPMTARAFQDYRLDAATLSSQAVQVVRRMLAGEPVTPATSGMSAREWRELMTVIRPE